MSLRILGRVLMNALLKNGTNVLSTLPMRCVDVGWIAFISLGMAWPNDGMQGGLNAN
jgi:hypothetical protein